MIDPNNITNLYRTKQELEEFWLFCLLVAGKKSTVVANKLSDLLAYVTCPFDFLKQLDKEGALELHLRHHKVGQYNRITNAIRDSFNVNLRSASFYDLIKIKGCGPKSAAFFLLHSRGKEIPVLDTHILKYLREKGHDAPKQTPQNIKTYEHFSEIFKKEVAKEGKWATLAEADLEIWKSYSIT
jgi:thermostable 8-oxoguanine DNA glycosylase